jgi:hypothetical protein
MTWMQMRMTQTTNSKRNVTFSISIEDKEEKQPERSFYYLLTYMALSALKFSSGYSYG